MVTTRSMSRAHKEQMAERARLTLVGQNFLRPETAWEFRSLPTHLLTRPPNAEANPDAIRFVEVVDGLPDWSQCVLLGCIHEMQVECPTCKRDPDDGSKECNKREISRIFNKLWHTCPYINLRVNQMYPPTLQFISAPRWIFEYPPRQ